MRKLVKKGKVWYALPVEEKKEVGKVEETEIKKDDIQESKSETGKRRKNKSKDIQTDI